MTERSCGICDKELEPGEAVCTHSGCAAVFHKGCHVLAAGTRLDLKCPVCDRCWVFTREDVFPVGGGC